MTAQNVEGEAQRSGAASYSPDKEYCLLTTFDRTGGQADDVQMYFALQGDTMYMLSGGGSAAEWVQNIIKNPEASVKTPTETFAGMARVVTGPDEAQIARQLIASKYEQCHEGQPLSDWAREALPIAVDRAPHIS